MVNRRRCRGRHYYRNMRINKKLFCLLMRHKGGSINKKISINEFWIEKSIYMSYTKPRFRKNRHYYKKWVSLKNYYKALSVLFSKIMDDTVETEAKMDIRFVKNLSSLLALVSAVRENNFERHMQAEREMVKYCFA